MSIKIIGDTHFGDEGIIKIAGRPFKDLKDMEYTLIENWNSKCYKDDTILVNGDFSVYDADWTDNLLRQLIGHKILIKGNHDILTTEQYLKCGFETVYEYPIIVDDFYMISHEPKYVTSTGVYVNIFAHVHDNPNYRDFSSRGFCTSVERESMKYAPIDLDDIKKICKNFK